MTETPRKLGIGEDFLTPIRGICVKTPASVVVTVKHGARPLRTGATPGISAAPTLMGVLGSARGKDLDGGGRPAKG